MICANTRSRSKKNSVVLKVLPVVFERLDVDSKPWRLFFLVVEFVAQNVLEKGWLL